MAVVDKTRVTDEPWISWGAVIAGLFFVIAASWLLFLLGSAIGVSIADASDLQAMGQGLGWGAIIWLILTEIVVFFIGGLLAARLAGRLNDMGGLLHGLTLWSAGTVLMLILGSWGVGNLLQAGQAVVSGAVSVGKTVVQGVGAAGSAVAGAADTQLMTEVQAMLKRQAAQVAAQGQGVSREEVRRAIEQIDAQTLQSIAQQVIQGDTQGAQAALANATNLSQQEVKQIVNNVTQQLAQSPTVKQVTQYLNQQLNQIIAQVSQTSPQVSKAELSRAVENLDAATLGDIARQLVMGNTENAKNILTANTNLSEQEVNAVIDGVSQQVDQRVEQAKQQVSQTVEQVSNYTQAVMWTLFVSSVLALIAALIGGSLGARAV